MKSISRQRLRRGCQGVAPGEKRSRSILHAFDQEPDKELSFQPGLGAEGVFLGQVAEAEDRLHPLEDQLDLPTQTVEFENLGSTELLQAGPKDEVLRPFPREWGG